MVPGSPSVLVKMMTPRRFRDHRYAALVAPELYGGAARRDPMLIKHVFDRQLMSGTWLGYLNQLLAGAGWTSLFALPMIRQSTLIIAGSDDPVIPLVNAKIMHKLLPNCDAARARRRPRRPDRQRRRTGRRGNGIPRRIRGFAVVAVT